MATYLEYMEKARQLPGIFAKMGSGSEEFSSTDGAPMSGWPIAGLPFDQYEGADWRHDIRVLVDTTGGLWLYTRYQHYEDDGTSIYRERFLEAVDANSLYRWDQAGWVLFTKVISALERF